MLIDLAKRVYDVDEAPDICDNGRVDYLLRVRIACGFK